MLTRGEIGRQSIRLPITPAIGLGPLTLQLTSMALAFESLAQLDLRRLKLRLSPGLGLNLDFT